MNFDDFHDFEDCLWFWEISLMLGDFGLSKVFGAMLVLLGL